jgi:tRNA pseudouridine55 synthase
MRTRGGLHGETSVVASGVLVIDKPRGPTSHDIVARVRRVLGIRQIGHSGTLDPMATGVLVVAVGEATKLIPWLTAQDKTYETTIALGVETDTLDADGREVQIVPLGNELRQALSCSSVGPAIAPMLKAALAAERGRTSQVPPAFSALRQEGERAYARARRGEQPVLNPRPAQVRRLELVACSAEPATVSLALDVGKGYYVRALARDLAAALGTVGHLTRLRRTRSGSFLSEEALPAAAPADEILARMHSLARAAGRVLPLAALTDDGARDARQGRPVHPRDIDGRTPGPSAWVDPSGELVAVGERDESGHGRVLRGFGPR